MVWWWKFVEVVLVSINIYDNDYWVFCNSEKIKRKYEWLSNWEKMYAFLGGRSVRSSIFTSTPKWFFLHSKRKLRKCWQTKAWLLWLCLCPFRQITLNWWLKQRPLISHVSGALKSTIEVLTDLVSGQSCFLVHTLQSSCYVLTCWKNWEKALWSLF